MAKHRNFSQLNSGLTGRDHYDSRFSDSLERQVEWLRSGAGQKANAICKLLDQNNLNPSIILEVGCGTGAVIEELMRRNIGESYYALDYSDSAIKFIKETLPKVHAVKGDVQDCSMLFSEKKFDFVICSHVIEHLEYPEHFLSSLVQVNWDYLIVEVPLENLLFGKIKGIFQDQGDHPAGHVQFFRASHFKSGLADFWCLLDTNQVHQGRSKLHSLIVQDF